MDIYDHLGNIANAVQKSQGKSKRRKRRKPAERSAPRRASGGGAGRLPKIRPGHIVGGYDVELRQDARGPPRRDHEGAGVERSRGAVLREAPPQGARRGRDAVRPEEEEGTSPQGEEGDRPPEGQGPEAPEGREAARAQGQDAQVSDAGRVSQEQGDHRVGGGSDGGEGELTANGDREADPAHARPGPASRELGSPVRCASRLGG